MAGLNRSHLTHLRGASRLAVEATKGIVDTVEQMHRTIQRGAPPLGPGVSEPTRGVTGFVYRTVRGGVHVAGLGLDALLAPLADALPEGEASARRLAIVSAVNGARGDHLVRTGNPLAIPMSLRHRGLPIDPRAPEPGLREAGAGPVRGKVLVLVHGLCMNDLQWSREGADHGQALADALGCTPIYLRYNTGRPVGENGQELAALLETTLANWPVPVEELTILGHSMGGLVARGACRYALDAGLDWPRRLRNLVFLGTPHHGAPLERGSRGLAWLMELSPYLAPFMRVDKSVSAGIRDLRHGSVTRGKWRFVPLPDGVRCFAAAATLGRPLGPLAERLVGDGLVPVDSALGRHADPALTLAFPEAHQWIGEPMGHLELLSRPEVLEQMLRWLRD